MMDHYCLSIIFAFIVSKTCALSSCGDMVPIIIVPSEGFKVAATVLVSFENSEASTCATRVVYYKHTSKHEIVTPWTEVYLGDLSVLRLASEMDYQFMIYGREADVSTDPTEYMLLNSTVTIPSSYWPGLTAPGEFVDSITGVPTWELLAFDAHALFDDETIFNGFVMVDTDGDIVWFWQVTSPTGSVDNEYGSPSHVINQRPDYSFAVQTMVEDSPLQIISPSGVVIDSLFYDKTCLMITHEARIANDGVTVLSFKENWGDFTNLDVPDIGDVIVAWDPVTDSEQHLYNLFDYFDPSEKGFSQYYKTSRCNGTVANTLDWSHANSISLSSYDQSYIVSLRALSTVCSFKPLPDLGGVNWCIRSENLTDSDFAFEDELDIFFGQHSVFQLSNGNLLMLDNSAARVEGGYAGGGNSSRGIEYSLDWDTMTLSVVWQYPVAFTDHEGSNTVISVDDDDYDDTTAHKLIFIPNSKGSPLLPSSEAQTVSAKSDVKGQSTSIEVDANGEWVSTIVTNFWFDNPYRGTPFNTINGEHLV